MPVRQPIRDWQNLQVFVMNLSSEKGYIPFHGNDAPSTLLVSFLVKERRLSPSVLTFARDVEALINACQYESHILIMTPLEITDARKAITNLRTLIDAATHFDDDPFAYTDLLRCWIETRTRWSAPV